MRPPADLTGQRFGSLVAVACVGSKPVCGGRLWRCLCDCTREKVVLAQVLRAGKVTRCGPLHNGAPPRAPLTVLSQTWRDMRARCLNPKHPKYPLYGGRGITVCERWGGLLPFGGRHKPPSEQHKAALKAFASDMGPRPASGDVRYSIERRQNDQPYEPGNCFWAPIPVQVRNRRSTVTVVAGGRTMNITDWARLVSMGTHTIRRWAGNGKLEAWAQKHLPPVAPPLST